MSRPRQMLFSLMYWAILAQGLGPALWVDAQSLGTNAVSANSEPPQDQKNEAEQLLREASLDSARGDLDSAWQKVNSSLQRDPENEEAYIFRGNLSGERHHWLEAQSDYSKAQRIAPDSAEIKFNLAELAFMQKDYAAARKGFTTVLENQFYGDLAAYKVFLCDLLEGNQDASARELAVFDKAGANASYYYSHAAWAFLHGQPDDAQSWLKSAQQIYSPQKRAIYGSALEDLGYLPVASVSANSEQALRPAPIERSSSFVFHRRYLLISLAVLAVGIIIGLKLKHRRRRRRRRRRVYF